MTPSQTRRSTRIEFVLATGLALIGLASGQGPMVSLVATTLAGVGGNWIASLAEKGFSRWRDSWFTDSGALNHDIAWALSEAYRQAVEQLKRDWQKSPDYQQLRGEGRRAARESVAVFDTLLEEGGVFLANAGFMGSEIESEQMRLLLHKAEPAAREIFGQAIGDALGDSLAAVFVKERLADQWLFRFWEVLKDPGEPGTRALRAFQRLWQRNLDTAIQELQDELQRTGRSVQEIDRKTDLVLATLDRLPGLLVNALRADTALRPQPSEPPPALDGSVPPYSGFVGRQRELAYYRQQLEDRRLALIIGMAGIGKQYLAARIAGELRPTREVYWMTFHETTSSADAVIESLASYLYHRGQPETWERLQREREAGERFELNRKIEPLLNALTTGNYLFCFQNYHLVNDDPEINQLFAMLYERAGQNLWLLITSLEKPDFATGVATRPLTGLDRAETKSLLKALLRAELSEPQFELLYRTTDGNPQFLALFCQTLSERDSEAFAWDAEAMQHALDDIMQAGDIRLYLLSEVCNSLSDDEQRLAELLSVFRLPIPERDGELMDLLAGEGLASPGNNLDALIAKHTLTCSPRKDYVEYHPLMRQFFYHRLTGQPELAAHFHEAIGDYYEYSEGNLLEAAHHRLAAGARVKAIRALFEEREALVTGGRAGELLRLLQPLKPRRDEMATWALTSALRGQVYAFLGDYENALQHFEEAHGAFEKVPLSSADRLAAADVARQIARAYGRRNAFDRAHTFMQQGLDILGKPESRDAKVTAALLHAHTGSLFFWQDQFENAERCCRQALDLLSGLIEREQHAEIYKILGAVLDVTGRWDEAKTYASRSAEIWKQLGNGYRAAEANGNLATLHFYRGELTQAEALYRANLDFWETLGATVEANIARSNLGSVHQIRGDMDQARECFDDALAAFETSGLSVYAAAVHNNLGLLELGLANYLLSQEHFELSRAHDSTAENLRGLSESALGLGHPAEARSLAEESLRLAIEDAMPFERAVTLRALGKAQGALQDLDAAQACLAESVSSLRHLGARYELAHTLFQLSLVERRQDRHDAAEIHLSEATNLFRQIGAEPDLEKALQDVHG